MVKKYNLKEILLSELTTTSTVGGYLTPKAFTKPGSISPIVNYMTKIFKWEIINNNNNTLHGGLSDYNYSLNEELSTKDYQIIKKLIRSEIAILFFDLFKRKNIWQ